MESACRSIPPDAYLEVSGRWRIGLVRKQFFNLLKAFWQELFQFHGVSFFVKSRRDRKSVV